ncbi:MAG: YdcF family protein [Bryobacteraceae bacterium]
MRRFLLRLLLLLLIAAALSYSLWFPFLGTYLVLATQPEPADAIIVLAGDYAGQRIETGGDLVRRKFAPYALISGPYSIYGQNEANLAIDYATTQGYPRDLFRPIYHHSDSTRDEALAFRPYLLEHNLRKIIIVTSDFHTRRAGAIFRRTIPEVQFHMIAAPTPGFEPASWWKSRPARKLFLQEWIKTLADWLGI